MSRVPPHNFEAERGVLGAIMLRPDRALDDARNVGVLVDDFHHPSHRMIFSSILSLSDKGRPIDTLTVHDELRATGAIAQIEGGEGFLFALLDEVPTAEHAIHYARIVRDVSSLRRMIVACSEVASEAHGGPGDVCEFLDGASKRVLEIASRTHRDTYEKVALSLNAAIRTIEARRSRGSAVTGVPTGFLDIDQLTTGLQPGDLTVLAARPSMGKTCLALNISCHAAVSCKVPVLFFSLEMSRQQLVERMICAEGRIDAGKMRAGFIGAAEWINLTKASSRLHAAPMFVDDSSSPTVMEIRSKARLFAADRQVERVENAIPGLIIVDYIQLVRHPSGRKDETREREVAEVSRNLKALAKDLGMPVLVLSQLNRGVERRDDKRPMLSDLRESGAIEQDADVIMFIYRDEFYNKESQDPGVAEIIIGKQRNGPTGVARLAFVGEHTRFDNLSQRRE